MKILIDIGHPAHVHYFKNFIKIMESKGHVFFIIAKNREMTYDLLNYYKNSFIKRRDFPKSMFGKLLMIFFTDLFVIYHSLKFKPDILIGISGTHIAHAGKLLNIPSIVLDDTDHAHFAHASYVPFARTILTTKLFAKDFGEKQIRFNSFLELMYLHENYFKPNQETLKLLNIGRNEKYAIVRFVSWNASHDYGHNGISLENKYNIVNLISKKYKVFISSQLPLPEDLEKYRITIPTYLIHDVIAYSSLYVGEGATMAAESAILGVPSVFINNAILTNLKDLEQNYNIVSNFQETLLEQNVALKKIEQLILTENNFEKFKSARDRIHHDKIDLTAFLVWFVEEYPKSVDIMKKQPEFQYRFR